MTFGEKLKEARKLSGLSQEQFAEALNISRSAVAKWENNMGIPDVANLKSISKLLNISIDCLLDNNVDIEANQIKPNIVKDNTYLNNDCIELCPEYEGYYCAIELIGWNDGVYDVIIIGQDSNFLYYQKSYKKKLVYGMIGKKYIVCSYVKI
ncbi:MAG: helix-turn-helix transcriptional regulator [Lachnospiraceae bacterium]|nr:helix-turn-helix transcriptional regulator [Lachnospiraceae bacterium]